MKICKFSIIIVLVLCLTGLSPFPCQAEDKQTVSIEFQRFVQKWVDTLQKSYKYTQDAPELIVKGNQHIARYFHLDASSIKTEVKKAENTKDMYTGVLQYREYLFQSIGKTRDLAASGDYTVRSVRQMTEIFLYDNGTWVR
jgi:hypothetical protein